MDDASPRAGSGSLQRQVNDLHAPDWMPSQPEVPTGSSVVHLDLHPMNVMLGSDGPMIIDWTNAGRGEAWFDAALSFVLMSTFEVSGIRDRIGQQIFTAAFAQSRGRRDLKRSIGDACTYRLSDKNITAADVPPSRSYVCGPQVGNAERSWRRLSARSSAVFPRVKSGTMNSSNPRSAYLPKSSTS